MESSSAEPIANSQQNKLTKAERKALQKNKANKEGAIQNVEKPILEEKASDKGNDIKVGEQKSKSQLKAERRMLQEAQRAAKAQAKVDGVSTAAPAIPEKQAVKKVISNEKIRKRSESCSKSQIPSSIQMDDEKTRNKESKKLEKQQVPQRENSQRKVRQFIHLHQYEKDLDLTKPIKFIGNGNIHPAIIKLGLQYADGIVLGSNARCIAFLAAIKQVILNYSTPEDKDLSRDLEVKLRPNITFLNQCRKISTSMGNAIKFLKWQISHVPVGMTENDAKKRLLNCIDEFIQNKIILAGQAIAKIATEKIKEGDVLLLYACSSTVFQVIMEAHKHETNFKVIVVDSRPKLEGKTLLSRLVEAGIQCSYTLINAISYIIPTVTKVFLGAHAILANGYIMSRVGTSQIAMVAKAFNVPVILCCESYKFSERVQTDSFVYNELGDPSDLVNNLKIKDLIDWKSKSQLRLLNLLYDVTPPEMVSVVITELGMLPCSSAPVLLRVKPLENLDYK